jgi:hypothetical protein
MTDLKWTKKTTKKISLELSSLGIKVGAKTVGRLLKKMGFSLKSNRKTIISGGKRKPGYRKKRNDQFLNISKIKGEFEEAGNPIISVDTKKKEMIGNFKNNGKSWNREGEKVHDHDFKSDSSGMAAPYGIYDQKRNKGHVVIGLSKDVPSFATDSIEEWWLIEGRKIYPRAKSILILADGGGSNSSRSRVWKKGLQEKLSNKYNLSIKVCHYPPGASKWNPIEHRLFSEISKNWAAVPLKDLETIKNYISTTTTATGLKVTASINQKTYAKGEKVTKKDFEKIKCAYADVLPEWNYTIYPNL